MCEVWEIDGPPPTRAALARRARNAEIIAEYESTPIPLPFRALTEILNRRGMVVSWSTVRSVILAEGERLNRRNMPRCFFQDHELRHIWCALFGTSRLRYNNLVFSDEKRFEIDREPRGSRYVWVRPSQPRLDPRRIRLTSGQNSIKLMAFGIFKCNGEDPGFGDLCFVPSGASGTVTSNVYNDVLLDFVAPYMKRYVLLEDNASSHKALSSVPMPFERIRHGTYPPHSPDFNAIERMWAVTQFKVNAALDRGPLKDRSNIPHLRRLIRETFNKVCRSSAAIAAVNSTWENLAWGAAHQGQQKPG